MGQVTEIAWCDHTFNPWIGCTKVSDGCKHCYAETLMDTRWGKVKWGPQGTRVRTSKSNWHQPKKWNAEAKAAGVRRKVFCASLADVFEDRGELKDFRGDLCELIEQCRNLDWLLLTKRPANIERLIVAATGRYAAAWLADCKHVWLGTSVENQQTADERIPHLLKCPAAIRFLSVEPLLGPIELPPGFNGERRMGDGLLHSWAQPFIDWCIVGGESGPRARPCNVEWIRSIVRQCKAAGVSCFVKQLGAKIEVRNDSFREWPREGDGLIHDPSYTPAYQGEACIVRTEDPKGGNPEEWPSDLRVRQMPEVKP